MTTMYEDVLQGEIDGLYDQITALKKRIAELEAAPVAPAEPTYLSAMSVEHAKQHAQRLADQIDPMTRKEPPDNLTAMCAAQALRILAAPVAPAEP